MSLLSGLSSHLLLVSIKESLQNLKALNAFQFCSAQFPLFSFTDYSHGSGLGYLVLYHILTLTRSLFSYILPLVLGQGKI